MRTLWHALLGSAVVRLLVVLNTMGMRAQPPPIPIAPAPTFVPAPLLGFKLMYAQAIQVEPPEYPAGTFCTPRGKFVNGRQTDVDPCTCNRLTQFSVEWCDTHRD